MTSHLARRGGIWWVRLVVPERLRLTLGRREFSQSCRTANVHQAKTIAASLLAEWRLSMMRVEFAGMDSQAERLLAPAPLLGSGSTVTLAEAETLGVNCLQLLRVVAAGKAVLHCRMGLTRGHLVAPQSLPNDHYLGVKEIPAPKLMPSDAVESSQAGLFPLPDSPVIANALLVDGVDGNVEIVAVQATAGRWFVPDKTLRVPVKALEVSTNVVKTIRDHLASRISPAEIQHERSGAASRLESGTSAALPHGGVRAKELFSKAVEKYCSDPDGLPQKLQARLNYGSEETITDCP